MPSVAIISCCLFTTCTSQSPEYLKQRAELVQTQCTESTGGKLALSHDELIVDRLLRDARAEFNLTSGSFFELIPSISKSRLFQLLQPLPKGAALHLHYDSLLESAFLVDATYDEHCHICWPDRWSAPTAFRFFDSSAVRVPPLVREGMRLDGTCASGWILVAELRAAAPDVAAFDERLYRSLSLVPASLAPYPNVDAAWAKFETIFPLSVGILDFEPVFRR